MGFYGDRILPRVIDLALSERATGPMRARVCEGLAGAVVEIGFGSGGNVPHYPAAVTGVAAVEPSDLAWQLAQQRLQDSTVPVRRSGVDGQRLSLPDGAFDCALSSWTLCTIPDAGAALAEIRRVLRPGGTLHFVEHGLAPDAGVQKWQHRLEPLQKAVFGGCHLTRPVLATLTDAGFEIRTVDSFYESGTPKPLGAMSLGIAGPA